VPPQKNLVRADDEAPAPGSLRLQERRSWPTWTLVTTALVAGAVGALIGYLPNSGTTDASPSGPSFPSGPIPSPTTQAHVPSTTTTVGSSTTTLRSGSSKSSVTTTVSGA
jgi:hypothetical protein